MTIIAQLILKRFDCIRISLKKPKIDKHTNQTNEEKSATTTSDIKENEIENEMNYYY